MDNKWEGHLWLLGQLIPQNLRCSGGSTNWPYCTRNWRAQAGHLRVTLVGGEPGIGKTRLLVDANSEYSYAGCDFRTGSDRHIRVSGISVFLG